MKRITSGRKLIASIRDYIEECRNTESKKPVFANVAGFCRFAGISVQEFHALQTRFPDEFESAGAYFEDAALNSGATASLVGMYLREYGFWGKPAAEELVCEHDSWEDGV